MKHIITLLLVATFFSGTLSAQSVVQYRNILHQKNVSDTTKLNAYLALSNILLKKQPDSAFHLLQKAEEFGLYALHHIRRAGVKQRLLQQLGEIFYLQASYQLQNKNYGVALALFQQALEYFEQANDTLGISSAEQSIGGIYQSFGDYQSAMKVYKKSLQKVPQKSLQYANLLTKIASIYQKTGKTNEAIKFYNQSFEIYKQQDTLQAAKVLKNLAVLSGQVGDTVAALDLFKKSLELNYKLNDEQQIFDILVEIGRIYLYKNSLDSAFEYFLSAYGVANRLSPAYQAKAQFYIAQVYFKKKKLKKAEDLAKMSLQFAEFEHDTLLMIDVADLLKEINLAQSNCPQALKYLNLKEKLEASFWLKLNKQKVEQSIHWAVYRSELTIDSLRRQLSLQKKAYYQQQTKFSQTLVLGTIFIFFLLLFVLLLFIKQKKTSQQLAQLPDLKELLKRIEAYQLQTSGQSDKIKHLELVLRQDEKNALALMSFILPSESLLQGVQDFFKLYIPRQEISGDFYWWTQIEDALFVAVADTTGNGISGAVFSTFAISLLADAVYQQKLRTTSKILQYLNENVHKYLLGDKRNNNDSIEIALVKLNLKTKELEFSAAKQSIFILSSQKLEYFENEHTKVHLVTNEKTGYKLYEFKSVARAMGILSKNHIFTHINVKLYSSDLVYLFTDGFYNQFGGEFNEKFGKKKFRKLVLEISDLPMNEQKLRLEEQFKLWRGDKDQTDDVTIVGLKI